ncbi:Uncharacterized protein dnm_003240 [Desulfonema magnum]|uniref:Uncharacterized protein n=1 Tax=Desulfonema magnum TaxID=45655 RepID=A0A975GKB2_9BACT|nr:Uncharacterized protein dnm_003240 [Desulfonema magnum]
MQLRKSIFRTSDKIPENPLTLKSAVLELVERGERNIIMKKNSKK